MQADVVTEAVKPSLVVHASDARLPEVISAISYHTI